MWRFFAEGYFLEHFLFMLSPAERQTSSAPANTERRRSSESADPEERPVSQALIKPEDLEPIEPGSSLKTLRTLRRPRAVQDQFMTSSSLIGPVSDNFTSSKSEIDKYSVHLISIHINT